MIQYHDMIPHSPLSSLIMVPYHLPPSQGLGRKKKIDFSSKLKAQGGVYALSLGTEGGDVVLDYS
jgi:hypothetical protein